MYVGRSRLTEHFWDLPLSRMKIVTATIEALPYAIRGVFSSSRGDNLSQIFVKLRKYIALVLSETTVPDASVKQLGIEYIIFCEQRHVRNDSLFI